MTTATGTEVGKQISDLLAEANELEQEGRAKLVQAGEKFAAIRDLADQHSGDYQVGSNGAQSSSPSPSASATATRPAPAKKRTGKKNVGAGTPKKKATAAKKTPAKKNRNKRSGKVDPSDRNYDNEISLKEAIWQVLEMGPDQWDKVLEDFPEDAEGLKVSEVKEIIEVKEIWISSSDNISPQIQQHLYNFKKAGKVARGEDRRYYIVEGATLED